MQEDKGVYNFVPFPSQTIKCHTVPMYIFQP